MSIHPRMSFIDQDAVELWPFEVNGAAVGGEWELSMSPRKRIAMTSPRLWASEETRDPILECYFWSTPSFNRTDI